MSDSDRAEHMGGATREKLRQFIARIERLEAEKAECAADIREVYAEVKAFGFDTKVLRKVITRRKQDASERAEQEALLELYEGAVEGLDVGEAGVGGYGGEMPEKAAKPEKKKKPAPSGPDMSLLEDGDDPLAEFDL